MDGDRAWWFLGASVRAIVFFALWLLLVDATDEPNMLTGAVVAIVAAALASAVQSLRTVHPRPRPAMLRYAYRPLVLLLSDTARVSWALVERGLLRRHVTGRWRAARYRAAGDSADDAARRILTEWGASVGPNRYVIGVDAQARTVLVHELVRSSGPLDPMELG